MTQKISNSCTKLSKEKQKLLNLYNKIFFYVKQKDQTESTHLTLDLLNCFSQCLFFSSLQHLTNFYMIRFIKCDSNTKDFIVLKIFNICRQLKNNDFSIELSPLKIKNNGSTSFLQGQITKECGELPERQN